MTIEALNSCTMLLGPDSPLEAVDIQELRRRLETGNDRTRVRSMVSVLRLMANGEPCSQLLMTIIRFVMPTQKNKLLKKLILLYLENVPKLNEAGKLREEMLLVWYDKLRWDSMLSLCSNALRNELQHPNEYVRGVTLRFLCKLHEPELLEPLIPSIRSCLEHRHAYVRRNAITAISSIYHDMDYMIPDGPELVEAALATETDAACQRNAFIMLSRTEPARARNYYASVADRLQSLDPMLQMAVIEFIRRDALVNPAAKGNYIKCLFTLLTCSSNLARFESATSLLSLTATPSAIKAVAACFVDLAVREHDNNIKLIVLGRLAELQQSHAGVLDGLVLEILRVLGSSDLSVRSQTLEIALRGVSLRSVLDVVALFRRELVKPETGEYENAKEYRMLLLNAINRCAIKFPSTSEAAVSCFLEALSDLEDGSAFEVAGHVKEMIERVPKLRPSVIDSLLGSLPIARDAQVLCNSLWIVGEYCRDAESIEHAFKAIRASLGEQPLLGSEERREAGIDDDGVSAANGISSGMAPRILPDGTYASETAMTSSNRGADHDRTPALKWLLLEAWYNVGAVLSATMVKLVLHLSKTDASIEQVNSRKAESMLTMAGIIRLGLSKYPKSLIDEDSYERIVLCLRVLSQPEADLEEAFAETCRQTFGALVQSQQKKMAADLRIDFAGSSCKIDEAISFRRITPEYDGRSGEMIQEDYLEKDLAKAIGDGEGSTKMMSSLNRVVQLTGFSDAIYAETYVTVSQHDILLDILLVNQTSETLQNVSIDLAASGNLKVVEKPVGCALSPHGFASVKAGIKVSATDNGSIFGTICFGHAEAESVVLNSIRIDVLDYIRPAIMTDDKFRRIWTLLEWENKIDVATKSFADLKTLFEFITREGHLTCISTGAGIKAESEYLATNLYAKSIFGEDILANACLEQSSEDGSISGTIRLRTKTQGAAVAIGDKINVLVHGRLVGSSHVKN